MTPIYNEYINFLKAKTNKQLNNEAAKLGFELKENYYWLDKSIIKYFNSKFEVCKLCRLYIGDDLSLTYKFYKELDNDIISWSDLVKHNEEHLLKIERRSLDLIKTAISEKHNAEPIILSSTGKDSQCITYLVRQVVPNALIVCNNTSLDCAESYIMMNELDNKLILSPKEGFYQWRERNNFVPTRFARACCGIFKEGVFADYWNKDKPTIIFLGMRNAESNTRSGYGDYWNNPKWSDKWQGVLPIRKWTEMDVWLYTFLRNIPINRKYKYGYSRVGCAIACPYYTKSTWILDEYFYPKLYKRWHDILDNDFVKNNKDIILNCTQEEYHLAWNGGKHREIANEQVISEFAARNDLDINVAKKYFDQKCHQCGKPIKGKDTYGMNLKMFGRHINKFLCRSCLMKDLGLNKKEWNEKVEDFKSQNCKLF